MPIAPLAAVAPVSGAGYLDGSGAAASPTGGVAFGDQLTGAVDELRSLQSTSNELAIQAVTGDLDDIHAAMLASTRAQVTFELVAAVRNKGVDAFNEIMRMQA